MMNNKLLAILLIIIYLAVDILLPAERALANEGKGVPSATLSSWQPDPSNLISRAQTGFSGNSQSLSGHAQWMVTLSGLFPDNMPMAMAWQAAATPEQVPEMVALQQRIFVVAVLLLSGFIGYKVTERNPSHLNKHCHLFSVFAACVIVFALPELDIVIKAIFFFYLLGIRIAFHKQKVGLLADVILALTLVAQATILGLGLADENNSKAWYLVALDNIWRPWNYVYFIYLPIAGLFFILNIIRSEKQNIVPFFIGLGLGTAAAAMAFSGLSGETMLLGLPFLFFGRLKSLVTREPDNITITAVSQENVSKVNNWLTSESGFDQALIRQVRERMMEGVSNDGPRENGTETCLLIQSADYVIGVAFLAHQSGVRFVEVTPVVDSRKLRFQRKKAVLQKLLAITRSVVPEAVFCRIWLPMDRDLPRLTRALDFYPVYRPMSNQYQSNWLRLLEVNLKAPRRYKWYRHLRRIQLERLRRESDPEKIKSAFESALTFKEDWERRYALDVLEEHYQNVILFDNALLVESQEIKSLILMNDLRQTKTIDLSYLIPEGSDPTMWPKVRQAGDVRLVFLEQGTYLIDMAKQGLIHVDKIIFDPQAEKRSHLSLREIESDAGSLPDHFSQQLQKQYEAIKRLTSKSLQTVSAVPWSEEECMRDYLRQCVLEWRQALNDRRNANVYLSQNDQLEAAVVQRLLALLDDGKLSLWDLIETANKPTEEQSKIIELRKRAGLIPEDVVFLVANQSSWIGRVLLKVSGAKGTHNTIEAGNGFKPLIVLDGDMPVPEFAVALDHELVHDAFPVPHREKLFEKHLMEGLTQWKLLDLIRERSNEGGLLAKQAEELNISVAAYESEVRTLAYVQEREFIEKWILSTPGMTFEKLYETLKSEDENERAMLLPGYELLNALGEVMLRPDFTLGHDLFWPLANGLLTTWQEAPLTHDVVNERKEVTAISHVARLFTGQGVLALTPRHIKQMMESSNDPLLNQAMAAVANLPPALVNDYFSQLVVDLQWKIEEKAMFDHWVTEALHAANLEALTEKIKTSVALLLIDWVRQNPLASAKKSVEDYLKVSGETNPIKTTMTIDGHDYDVIQARDVVLAGCFAFISAAKKNTKEGKVLLNELGMFAIVVPEIRENLEGEKLILKIGRGQSTIQGVLAAQAFPENIQGKKVIVPGGGVSPMAVVVHRLGAEAVYQVDNRNAITAANQKMLKWNQASLITETNPSGVAVVWQDMNGLAQAGETLTIADLENNGVIDFSITGAEQGQGQAANNWHARLPKQLNTPVYWALGIDPESHQWRDVQVAMTGDKYQVAATVNGFDRVNAILLEVPKARRVLDQYYDGTASAATTISPTPDLQTRFLEAA